MASSVDQRARPYTRTMWALMVVAVLWSLGLLVAAETIPAYDSETVSSSVAVGGPSAGHQATMVAHTTATLVEVNGLQALVFLAIPLLASLIVAVALLRRHTGWVARGIAWGVTGAIALLTLLSMLTVGPAMLPVTGCLVMACAFDLGRSSAEPVTAG